MQYTKRILAFAVVTVNPKLKSGAFLEAGSVLLGIDPTDYVDNEVREANSRRSLAIENRH